jgi:cytochrome d ubiquinol oxidase subunit I
LLLTALVVCGPLGLVAIEAGWTVTEVGRQPWIVYKVMRTSDAVTQADGIWVTFGVILGLYVALGAALIITLLAMSRRWRSEEEDEGVPYGPEPGPPPDLATEAPR